jgi:hypothetical protein
VKESPETKQVVDLVKEAIFLAASKIRGQGNDWNCMMLEAEHLGEL